VAPGRYVLMPRFGTFVYGHEIVEVSAKGPNYAAVMLPKRTAGAVTGTVSFEDLSRRSNQRLQGRIRQANQLLKKGDFEAAAREYEKILATDPAAGLYDGLALVYLQLGRKEEAYRALENALSENPKFLLPYSHLGSLYVDDRKHSELALLAAQALHVDSTWAGGHLLMAEAQLRSRNFAAAIRHARTADDLMRGKSPDPHLLLARALWMQNECGPAQEHLTHFLQLRTTAGLLPEFSQVIGAIRACTS
jgi:tetratricopeptide (TPR) repeat protein